MQGGNGLTVRRLPTHPPSPAGSAHGGWCGSWFSDPQTGDGKQEPKEMCEWQGHRCAPMAGAQRDGAASSWLSHLEGKLRQP